MFSAAGIQVKATRIPLASGGSPLTECNDDTKGEPEGSGWQKVFIGFYNPCPYATIHAEKTGQDVHNLYEFVRDGILWAQ